MSQQLLIIILLVYLLWQCNSDPIIGELQDRAKDIVKNQEFQHERDEV